MEDIENLADSLSAAQGETKAVLSDVMRLPERFRIPIVLYYYLGFSTSEIAELLHVPDSTVRTRLARGRSKLKFILEEGDREIQPNQAGFESVQADSDLADRVLYAAAGEPLRRKGHAKPLYVAVVGCLVGVLATGGVAYAVVNSGYFASAWGNHGNGESITWTQNGSSGTKYTYTREFGDGIAPQSLEGSVQKVNLSVEGNGYTLDIHDMAIDKNGCGAVTFTLSNPSGVSYYKPAAETGELVLYGEEEQGIGTPDMKFGEEWADTRCTIDKDTSSDTVINGTMYFASWDRERDLGHAVTWNICWTEGEGEDAKPFEASTPEFSVGAYVDTKELRSDDSPLEISPFSIQTHINDLGIDAVTKKLTVTYKDGSEQIIEDDAAGAYNLYVSLTRNSGENISVPTKLINVDQVVSVTLEGTRYTSTGETETEVPFTIVYS